jgi:hypothetical protein
VSKAAVVWSVCGGMLAGSGSKGGVGNMVVIGMGGKAGGIGQRWVAMCGRRLE